MILPIRSIGDPVLKKVAKDITPDHPGLKQFIADLYETMYAASGVGLAAPQVGESIRLFVVDCASFAEDEDGNPTEDAHLKDFKKVFINPYILEEDGEEWAFEEGCLSIPGIREDVDRQPKHHHALPQDETFKDPTRRPSTALPPACSSTSTTTWTAVLFTELLPPLCGKPHAQGQAPGHQPWKAPMPTTKCASPRSNEEGPPLRRHQPRGFPWHCHGLPGSGPAEDQCRRPRHPKPPWPAYRTMEDYALRTPRRRSAKGAQALVDVYLLYAKHQSDGFRMAPEYVLRAAGVKSALRDPQAAVDLYDRVIKRLAPIGDKAARCLLPQEPSPSTAACTPKGRAQQAYQEVIDRFPDHPFAADATADDPQPRTSPTRNWSRKLPAA
jgi:peptide deformylase